ncbi:ubiquitin-conjugating enzyme/RWD-like protein [Dichomitus squalens]|uniref:Ubiquitin-conjugating enzyme/RWD-like protein n=1 Tax=Dichomitus squalens TaxID=114155 RepID=A0A4Q9QEB6_9APHY|nr:ubiquitin-conjugating enzyme/RWD-like protein [Dichomitus squalens]TBU66065.1 ubiquitin-conjugating enzyme/RWD-like protein [Dichomitus squalens]
MAARTGLNKNNSAVKRIMQEARELANDPCTDYAAAPLEDDIFEWHCTIRGPPGTEFEGGLYHFRILLPSEYPFRPPAIMMLTPNGRFELNTKICISFTNYHEELWQPAWGVRTAIIGLQGFFPLKGTAAVGVGAIEYPTAERKRLAALSREWVCPRCNMSNLEHLPDPPASDGSASSSSSSSGDNSSSTPSPAPVSSSDIPIVAVQSPNAQPVLAVETQAPMPEAHIVHRPVPLVAPKPTRPHAQPSIVTQSFTPPGTPFTQPATRDATPQPALVAAVRQTPKRPPVLLDTAICVLLSLMLALVARRFL